ncbi:MAG: DUF3027 domain-containing protein [Ignavibacteriales bacterium]|nr:DUF3027 domain-containing protein [Ignavibacteriales bacterium]
MNISFEEFNDLVKPLIGKPVSLAWKGHGTALFLEIGMLRALKDRNQNIPDGEVCISPDFEWRIEFEKRVLCGSSNWIPFIEEKLKMLEGLEILGISVDPVTLELEIKLTNDLIVRAIKLTKGDPDWTIRYLDDNYISVENSCLFYQNDNDPPDEVDGELEAREKEIIRHGHETYDRWSAITLAPKRGKCDDCKFYIRIDSDSFINDFGICSNQYSAFDGKAVYSSSGCPAFVE